MSKDSSHLTALFKQVIKLVKFTFLLLVTVIALLAGALVILFNLYRREKRSDEQQKAEPAGVPN